VTDPERDHFVRQIRDLERRLRRSHLVTAVLAVLLLIPLVGAVLLALVLPTFIARERATLMEIQVRAAEAEARAAEAEAARLRQLAGQGTGKRPGTGKE
jgi:hypothetical protein